MVVSVWFAFWFDLLSLSNMMFLSRSWPTQLKLVKVGKTLLLDKVCLIG